jgi:hypothetical protein
VDLSAWLLRHTPPRPLVVTAPGGTAARLAVERAVRERGWRPALSPAAANLLVVAGEPRPALEPYLRQAWQLVPAPRARVAVPAPQDATERLDSALLVLRDVDHQREQATQPAEHVDQHERAEHHESHDGHGDHGAHGHHMDGMGMLGGVPMADRADDRDGLKLDQLHVPLGPLLPLWPAGLVIHTRLQGDVIQDAAIEVLDGAGSSWPADGSTARRLDSAARLLALTGWMDASITAQRFRDETLAGRRPPLTRWSARVRRSRTLRWLLGGVGSVANGPARLTGDALDRLYRWLDATAEPPSRYETQWTVDNLPSLLVGTELATARLVVASLDPDLELLAHREAHHG